MATQVGRKDAQLIPGTQLKGTQGRIWKVGGKIGQGQCCVAYSGTLMGEDVHSAVKVFNPQLNYSAACQREAKLLDILHRGTGGSKFLVNKFDEFRHNQNEVLVCELLGDSLQVLLAHHVDDKMSLWMIQKLLLDIFRGLEILHTRGFVHADIKPGNIHWCPGEYCAKLIDYGLTFHIQDKVKGVVQSTHYRAPESGNIVGACHVNSQAAAGQTIQHAELMSTGGGAIHGVLDSDSAIMPRNPNISSMRTSSGAMLTPTYSRSDGTVFVTGARSDRSEDSTTESQSGTSGTVKMKRKRGIVHHKPSATLAGDNPSGTNISSTNNCQAGQNQINNKNFHRDLHSNQPTEPASSSGNFAHQPSLPSLYNSSNKSVSNRHGVVHHRPVHAAFSDAALDTKQYSLNQGASSYGANTCTNFEQYLTSAETGFQCVGFQSILSQDNSKLTTDPRMTANVNYTNMFVKPKDYSALTELTRITRTVCNCVTCGRHLSCAIDIWSIGCLIVKMFLGGHGPHFSGKPKCENCVGHDSQMACKVAVDAGGLIRVREEDREVQQKSSVIADLKELVQRCLSCQPSDRISVAAALSHPFFHHSLTASYRDMLVLPSPVLCLLNMVDEADLENRDEHSDIEDDIKEECEKYGEVNTCILCKAGPEKSKVFVHFVRARDCMAAWKCLNGKTFNSRTVITCYYPLDKFDLDVLNKIT